MLGDAIHIGGRGATVDGGDIAPVQLIHAAAKRLKQLGTTLDMGRTNDHSLPTPNCQTGQSRLVAHVLSQMNGIVHSTFVVGIRQITATAQRWPQMSVMNGNHGFEACNGVYA